MIEVYWYNCHRSEVAGIPYEDNIRLKLVGSYHSFHKKSKFWVLTAFGYAVLAREDCLHSASFSHVLF